MNLPPDKYILVEEERELEFLNACFAAAGIDAGHGELVSRLLVNSDLRGVRSHGISYAPGYCRSFREGKLNAHPDVRIAHETPTSVVLDGDGTLGYMPMTRAAEHAVAKAREVGMGMGLVRHIGHYGSAGHYARMCMESGCIGFSVQGFRNDGDAGGREPKPSVAFTGAPPICFAVPAGDEPPIVLDMVAHALSGHRGEEDRDLYERIPSAFFKSMGFVAVATLLGGGLTGFTLPEGDAIEARWEAARCGGMVLAIDVASVLPDEVFSGEVDRYIKAIRETYEPMPGNEEALLPGAIEEQILEKHRREGIRFGEREQNAAQNLNEYLDVPLPWD